MECIGLSNGEPLVTVPEVISKTGERLIPGDFGSVSEYCEYLRHLFAYQHAAKTLSKSMTVLDLGFGDGYGTKHLSGQCGKAIGVEVDPDAVRHASRKYGSDRCEFQVYDGKKLPFEDAMFDRIISFQVIEHVPDELNYVKEIARVLKPGGSFIVTTPNKRIRLRPNQKPWNKFHFREYYPEELEALLKQGFRTVEVKGVKAKEPLQTIETERVKQYLKWSALDILNLRRLLPKSLKSILLKFFRKVTTPAAPDDFKSRFSVEDYFLTDSHLDDSLDLLAVCR